MFNLPLVSPLDRVLFLRTQPHFSGLDPRILIVIANNTQEYHFRSGEALYDASSPRRHMHFLVEGTVHMQRDDTATFDVSAPGGVGMVHELARTEDSTSAIAKTDVTSLCIEIERYFQIMEDHFALVHELINNFGRMIGEAEHALVLAPGGETCVDCQEPASHEPLDLVQRLSRTRRAPLFANANLTMLTELLRETHETYVETGTSLFRAGENPHSLHLLFEGAVRIEDPTRARIAYAGPGELVALGEFCRRAPHALSAVTETPVQLLRIDKTHYVDVLEDHFDHALELLAQLAQRHLFLQERAHALAQAA
jgi:CRP-like cAMP-binding protein